MYIRRGEALIGLAWHMPLALLWRARGLGKDYFLLKSLKRILNLFMYGFLCILPYNHLKPVIQFFSMWVSTLWLGDGDAILMLALSIIYPSYAPVYKYILFSHYLNLLDEKQQWWWELLVYLWQEWEWDRVILNSRTRGRQLTDITSQETAKQIVLLLNGGIRHAWHLFEVWHLILL